jgi:hypothetical protein
MLMAGQGFRCYHNAHGGRHRNCTAFAGKAKAIGCICCNWWPRACWYFLHCHAIVYALLGIWLRIFQVPDCYNVGACTLKVPLGRC